MTTRAYHHGSLAEALVASARALLDEAGADALSLRAVARRAGVSAMAPYRHFPDKEALLAAVAAHGFQGLRDALSAAELDAPAGGALVAQAVAYVRYACGNPAMFRLMFGPPRAGPHPDFDALSQTAYSVLADRVAAETPGPERTARTLGCWALVHGLAFLFLDGQLAREGGMPADELTREVAQAMLGGAWSQVQR